MAESATEYHHGDMDITEQQRTFKDAMGATKWAIIILAALIAALTLWFCTAAGFWSGAIVALVILVVGGVALRERPSAH